MSFRLHYPRRIQDAHDVVHIIGGTFTNTHGTSGYAAVCGALIEGIETVKKPATCLECLAEA